MFSGVKIKSSLKPNSYPIKQRKCMTELLAKEVYDYLVRNDYKFSKPLNQLELFDKLTKAKLSEPLSSKYRKTLLDLVEKIRRELTRKGEISVHFLDSLVLRFDNNTSYNTTRRHLNVLVNHLHRNGFPIEKSELRSRKQIEVLHKPLSDISEILKQLKSFNRNLYLCCLLTYGCLLRPHNEIRLLTWADFDNDLSIIRLTGNRVKSRRNRIVPVPSYITSELVSGFSKHNIFSEREKPYNKGYFALLWKRFKKSHPEMDKNVTLYSFRHSGSIEIYKRTGSLSKLQTAMGHSSLNVSLTYLRGLEVAELKEEDMPMV